MALDVMERDRRAAAGEVFPGTRLEVFFGDVSLSLPAEWATLMGSAQGAHNKILIPGKGGFGVWVSCDRGSMSCGKWRLSAEEVAATKWGAAPTWSIRAGREILERDVI